jgi:hypothetical protein
MHDALGLAFRVPQRMGILFFFLPRRMELLVCLVPTDSRKRFLHRVEKVIPVHECHGAQAKSGVSARHWSFRGEGFRTRGGACRPCSSPSDGTRAPGGSWTPSGSSGIGRPLRACRATVSASLPEMRDFTIQPKPREQRCTVCNVQPTSLLSSPASQEPSNPATASQSRAGSRLLQPYGVRMLSGLQTYSMSVIVKKFCHQNIYFLSLPTLLSVCLTYQWPHCESNPSIRTCVRRYTIRERQFRLSKYNTNHSVGVDQIYGQRTRIRL